MWLSLVLTTALAGLVAYLLAAVVPVPYRQLAFVALVAIVVLYLVQLLEVHARRR